ncbi:MAG: DUF89 family protein [Anaerolineaceae bacterium]|nr:DUF89 family protein [Anaerolineaceae bacterium]
MKLYLDCYSCVLRQTLQACRIAGVPEEKQAVIMNDVMSLLQEVDPSSKPPEIGAQMHTLIRNLTKCEDPYLELKRSSTKFSLLLYPELKRKISESTDPFDTAVRVSIAGNIIDFGASNDFDLERVIKRVLSQPYAIDHTLRLRDEIEKADTILFLADNAGETVFDRLLIETIDKPIIYAVKDAPVLNDATFKDAAAAGLDRVARVISCGARTPGTILSQCNEDFINIYEHADVIIAKGQGNYEALSEEKKSIFFLLQTKCDVIARDLGVPVGSIITKWSLL